MILWTTSVINAKSQNQLNYRMVYASGDVSVMLRMGAFIFYIKCLSVTFCVPPLIASSSISKTNHGIFPPPHFWSFLISCHIYFYGFQVSDCCRFGYLVLFVMDADEPDSSAEESVLTFDAKIIFG